MDQTASCIPPGVCLEDAPCPLGCSAGDNFVLTGTDRINGREGRFTVVACNGCGLMRTTPRPTPDTIDHYYPDDYGPYVGTRPKRRSAWSKALRAAARLVIDFRTDSIPKITPGKALEIGCASGSYLLRLAERGWQVVGVEFSATAAANARSLGFEVHTGALETISLPPNEFSLIVGWMVLEHLHRPVDVLRSLHVAAKPGAWLALSVPDSGSKGLLTFGDDWFPLQLPTHLFHYTPDSLEKVLRAGGWRLERCCPQRVLIDMPLSMALRVRSRHPDSRIARLVWRTLMGPSGLLFNLACYPVALTWTLFSRTARMTVWARREDAPCFE